MLLLLAVLFLHTPTCQAESNLVERPKRRLFSVLKLTDLPDSTKELADQLEISGMLAELYDQQHPASSERKAVLRGKILETILESYFDAASVQAEAEREQGRLEAFRQTLLEKRDRNVEVNNATNFIASGTLNTIGSALGFSATTPPFPGNLNQMLSGVVSTGMSTYALKQNNGGKTRGQGNPTIIAELFGRPTDDRTAYPESVWRFFQGKLPNNAAMTRAQALENAWINRHELERHGSHRERIKIDLVCGVVTPRATMTIGDLTDEINMISDVSAVASLMVHHLRDLLRMIDSDVVD